MNVNGTSAVIGDIHFVATLLELPANEWPQLKFSSILGSKSLWFSPQRQS